MLSQFELFRWELIAYAVIFFALSGLVGEARENIVVYTPRSRGVSASRRLLPKEHRLRA